MKLTRWNIQTPAYQCGDCYNTGIDSFLACVYSTTSLKSKTFVVVFNTLTYFIKYLLNHTSQGGQIW